MLCSHLALHYSHAVHLLLGHQSSTKTNLNFPKSSAFICQGVRGRGGGVSCYLQLRAYSSGSFLAIADKRMYFRWGISTCRAVTCCRLQVILCVLWGVAV